MECFSILFPFIALTLLVGRQEGGVGTYLSGTARAVPLLKVGRLVMHFAVPLFGHRLHIALTIDVSFIVT